jgi:hypothetical protein
MKWTGHVACVYKKRTAYNIWQGSVKKGDHLEDLGIDG